MRNFSRITERKRLYGEPTRGWEVNSKMDLEEIWCKGVNGFKEFHKRP
jgi:hypothetical protein